MAAMAAVGGARRGPILVNKQFNSPIKIYSPENVAEVLNKQTQVLENGAIGIDFHQPQPAPGHLANSAVFKMLAEEERQRGGAMRGLKRVAWPPPPDAESDFIDEQQPVFTKGSGPLGFAASVVRSPPPLQQLQLQQQQQPPVSFAPAPAPTSRWAPAPAAQPLQLQAQLQQSPLPGAGAPGQPILPPQLPEPYQPYQPPAQIFEPPPATVALRPQPPISQEPSPVIASQPAAVRGSAGAMRGDEKWPPVEYKERAAAENDARVALARGPAMRPRKVRRDYSKFFAQHALTSNYPSYRAPPGTQHYVEEGTSNF